MASPSKRIGVRAAAKILGVHENTIRNWHVTGVLTGYAIREDGWGLRFDLEDVEALAARQRQQALDRAERRERRKMAKDQRPLELRLADYRDAMAFMPPQLQDIIDRLPPGTDPTPLNDAIRFYTQVGIDLTKILNGEALENFRIEGVLPS